MQGYKIESFSAKTQDFINNEGLDTNKDGLINTDNGELAELLSRTGKSDVNELCYDNWFDAKKGDLAAAGIIGLGGSYLAGASYKFRPRVTLGEVKNRADKLYRNYNGVRPKPVALDIPETVAEINPEGLKSAEEWDKFFRSDIAKDIKLGQQDLQKRLDANRLKNIEKRIAWNKHCAEWKPKVPMKECLKESLKRNKMTALFQKLPISGMCGLMGIFGLGTAAYLLLCKPNEGVAKLVGNNDYTADERPRSEHEDQFRQVFGEKTELNEYTPQKGEYWISILKAKYGVDDATAQRMAHKIKEVIYNDPIAAKQPPVMYLPQTWSFEGNTYEYNKETQAEVTEKYSDDVKTEMGKMSKDLKLEE